MTHGGNVWQGSSPDEWLDFSANLRPEGTPAWVEKLFRRAAENVRYYPDPSMREAKRGLAAYANVDEDRILPTAGGAYAIDLMLSQGRGRVLIDEPTFGEYAARAKAHGRLCASADDMQIAPGDTRVLCNPNNPTGETLSREQVLSEYRRVMSFAGELVVDEAFIDYCPECSVRTDVTKGLTVVGSLTKILCVPGVRLGYICADREKIALLGETALPWQLNAFAALIAAELPMHLDDIRRDAVLNAARRAEFAAQLRALGASVFPSGANFLLCDFGQDMEQAVRRLKARRILVRSCASFGLGKSFLRLAVKTEEQNELLVEELKQCLKS
ncbi:MAG: histidinol-phosphate aminotransferase family protein [Clostridia bacterium]|nr:histidinol-phosphate aminotransferase family protein [Clostridia bacterium]